MRRATAIYRLGRGAVMPVYSTALPVSSAGAIGLRADGVTDAGGSPGVHLLYGKVTIASLALTTAVSTSGPRVYVTPGVASVVAADGKQTTLKTGTTSVFHGKTVVTFGGDDSSVVVESPDPCDCECNDKGRQKKTR